MRAAAGIIQFTIKKRIMPFRGDRGAAGTTRHRERPYNKISTSPNAIRLTHPPSTTISRATIRARLHVSLLVARGLRVPERTRGHMSQSTFARVWSAIVLSTCLLSLASPAQAPALINYQGRLLVGTNLVNGNVGLSAAAVRCGGGGHEALRGLEHGGRGGRAVQHVPGRPDDVRQSAGGHREHERVGRAGGGRRGPDPARAAGLRRLLAGHARPVRQRGTTAPSS
jgi:hypothetical protein